MPLLWQAPSAHKPCEQAPHMGDEKSQGTRKEDGRERSGAARSSVVLAACFTWKSKRRACSRASAYKAACKLTQQLPTLLCQQCWELLCVCWQWCANGCNNSQQYSDLQCIVGRIQPITFCKPCAMSVRGPNIVALRLGDHGTKEMLGVCWLKSFTGFKLYATTRNNIQRHATGNKQLQET